MTNIFNQSSVIDEDLGFFNEFQECMSPKHKDLLIQRDQKHNFAQEGNDFKIEGVLPHNELIWENNEIPSVLYRGFEIPSVKKTGIQFGFNRQFMSDNLEEIVPSTTNSDTSGLASSTSFQSSLLFKGALSLASKNEEISVANSNTQYEQTQSNDSSTFPSQIIQNLTKRNKREMKEEQKLQIKKKDAFKAPLEAKMKDQKTSKTKGKAPSKKKEDSYYETTYEMQERLTNKKKEYLEEVIEDKNGVFNYIEDPIEYKRARKRMQNRESAVRSRMRKRTHQDDLEVKIYELETNFKIINEENAGLTAQNALLKKQLSYFEDIFAKSSLVGFDQTNPSISKHDLEEFQINLMRKINARLHSQRDLETIPEDELESITRRQKNLEDIDTVSNSSQSQDINLNSLRLVRQKSSSSSFSGSGYLFLAIVFCMMCCSSLIVNTSNAVKFAAQSASLSKSILAQTEGRKLMFNENKESSLYHNLAAPLEDDVVMDEPEEEPIGVIQYLRMMLSGKYTYLTYMILSTTCFFFWMTPNCHKIQALFVSKKKAIAPKNLLGNSQSSASMKRKQSSNKQSHNKRKD